MVFISGSGTNLQAIIDAVAAGQLDAQIALVVSNRKAAYGLVRAEQAGIPTLYFPLKSYLDKGLSRETCNVVAYGVSSYLGGSSGGGTPHPDFSSTGREGWPSRPLHP